MFVAILNKEDKNVKTNKFNLADYAIIIVMALALTITIPRAISNYYVSQKEYEKAYKICSYPENTKHQIINEAFKNNDKYLLEKYLPIYIKDEKYKNSFYIINKFNYVIEENLNTRNYSKAIKYLEILYKYITENDNFSKVNESEIRVKKSVINRLLTQIDKGKKELENKEIKMWSYKFRELMNEENVYK